MFSIVKIAWRNTRRQFRRSALLGGAIAFGVMIITLLHGFTAGVVDSVKYNMAYATGGHILISGSELTETGREIALISDGTVLEDAILNAGLPLQSMHRRSWAFAHFIFGSRQASQWIDGVDFAVETDLLKGVALREGDLTRLAEAEQPIILPASVAERLGVQVGETVLARMETITGQVNVGEFTVVGISEDSTSFGMTSAYVDLHHLNTLLGLEPGQYQVLTIALDDMRNIDSSAETVFESAVARGLHMERPLLDVSGASDASSAAAGRKRQAEPWEGTKFEASTLNEAFRPIAAVFDVVDLVALGIFVVLLLITMVGITNTFRMVLIERTREIGTMRAFGMQRGTVRSVFLSEAAFIALGGGIVGIALAGIVMAVIARISMAPFPALHLFTVNGYFGFRLTPGAMAMNIAIVIVTALLAALWPANAGAKMPPAKALGGRF